MWNINKSIEYLKLPYSSVEFWGGRDPSGTLTGHFKTITFDTSGYDPTRDCESTGPLPLGFGFNNLEKLIWLKTEPGCIIRSHTLGAPYTTYKPDYNNTYTEKCLQKLKEVYIGDGATVLESYIFSAMLTESTSYDQYVYTYNSNYSVIKNNITYSYNIGRVRYQSNYLFSYYWKNNQWNRLTVGNIPLFENGEFLNTDITLLPANSETDSVFLYYQYRLLVQF